MSSQKGFTLIELIVVMVILAILAAYAIPKFYDFSTQANIAALNGLVGAVASASVTAHGAAIATNQTASTGQTITMEGSSVDLVYGYPAGTANGIVKALTVSSQFTTASASGTTTFTLKSNCRVNYVQSTGVTNTPGITTTITGC